jgi:VanZ family protein
MAATICCRKGRGRREYRTKKTLSRITTFTNHEPLPLLCCPPVKHKRYTLHIQELTDQIRVINNQWIRGGCIAAAFFMAATLFVGAEEIGKVNLVPAPFDKAEHFVYFGIMAVLLCVGLGLRWLWVALLAVPLVGALDEWHQYYVPGRESSVYDWMADAAGAAVAVYAYWRARQP